MFPAENKCGRFFPIHSAFICFFLFLWVLRCFSSLGLPSYSYVFTIRYMGFPCVFPHSEISGSLAMCAYPKLIAAYHVLHRLLMPRHSPCALCSLTYSVKIFQSFAFNITKNISWLTSQYVLKLYINSCAIFKEQLNLL